MKDEAMVEIPLETADAIYKMLGKLSHIAHKLGGEFDTEETAAYVVFCEATRDAAKAKARREVREALADYPAIERLTLGPVGEE